MKTINLSEQNSVMNLYLAELRDKDYQQNRLLFRNNLKRIGEIMAFEISKTFDYELKTVHTPLADAEMQLPEDKVVLATVLRAGLPFHEGFLHVFDHAGNAFVSAYRMYTNAEHTEVGVHTEYLVSMAAAIQALLEIGTPKHLHIACVLAVPEGLDAIREILPENSTVWCAAIDEGMNDHKYIVPGFGDAGDLCFGDKL